MATDDENVRSLKYIFEIAFRLILPSCLFIKFYTKVLVSILDVSSVKGCSKVCKLKTFATFCTSYYDYFTLLNRTVVLKFRDTTSIHRYISDQIYPHPHTNMLMCAHFLALLCPHVFCADSPVRYHATTKWLICPQTQQPQQFYFPLNLFDINSFKFYEKKVPILTKNRDTFLSLNQ